jgi:predicted negative regulator of RcsB-dependent stress response
MEQLKKFLSAVPLGVWLVVGVLVLVLAYWKSDDIGNWWERRTQEKVDRAIAEKEKEITALNKKMEEERALRREAEAREAVKAQEAEQLKTLIDQRGGQVEVEMRKIEGANKDHEKREERIDAVARGDISLFDFCNEECQRSATLGFPCRPNRCDGFKGR